MKRIILSAICVLWGLSVSAQDVKVSVSKYRDGKACATSFTFDDGCAFFDFDPYGGTIQLRVR